MSAKYEMFIDGIVARATPLWERLVPKDFHFSPKDHTEAEIRRKKWCRVLGSRIFLRRRINTTPYTDKDLKILLSGATITTQFQAWATTLSSVVVIYKSWQIFDYAELIKDRSLRSEQSVPFEEVFLGFILHARQQLRRKGGDLLKILSSNAVMGLEHQLLEHLSYISHLCIGSDYYHFRFSEMPVAGLEFLSSAQPKTTRVYQKYVEVFYKGRWIDLFTSYPVLIRLLCQSVDQWVDTTIDFCHRFLADFIDLNSTFKWEIHSSDSAIYNIQTGLSDRHQGGNSVFLCTMHNNEKVIYKPRSLAPEIAYNSFLEWLNQSSFSLLHLKKIIVVNKGTHGWVEYVSATACTDELEVQQFYRRTGILLCIFHALALTDIHFENLIAHKEHPVVIDLETLLDEHQKEVFRLGNEKNKFAKATSIIRTGFLPVSKKAEEEINFDLSGLCADNLAPIGSHSLTWQFVNTDQMAIVKKPVSGISLNHRVRLGDEMPSVHQHLHFLLNGFKEMYDCLLLNRQALLADNILMSAFNSLDLRTLIRNSDNYSKLQQHLLHPEFLKDGLDRSIELEWLARPACASKTPEMGRILVYEHERRDLENFDIPLFTTLKTSHSQYQINDPELQIITRVRDVKVLENRLMKLNSKDYKKQRTIIKRAIQERYKS